jgi:hypothetical protein
VTSAARRIARGLIADTVAVQTETQGEWLVCHVLPHVRPDDPADEDDLSGEMRLHTLDPDGAVPGAGRRGGPR